jgi:GT2 family glycosyltransferase/glycosyltransferase involved in cell wall biosynthesis
VRLRGSGRGGSGRRGSGRRETDVLILVQNLPVPFDRRVWQEALALVGGGYTVHVVCPATREYRRRRETLDGVRIYRYRPGPEARRSAAYLAEYTIAIAAQLWLALRIRLRHRIRVVHICNPPDLLFLVALPLVALGACLIYDHHDACPELMIAKGHRDGGWQVRLAKLLERLTYRFANVSIETNESYRDIALGRGHMPEEDVFVVRSAPDTARLGDARQDEKWRYGRKHLVGYVGVMGLQDGLDYLIDAARVIVCEWWREDIQFVLVGSGPEFPRLRERVRAMGIDNQVVFAGRLPDEDLAAVLATADVCVNPDEVNRMNDISTMNKVMEYMAAGKPIVQFDMREGRVSAGEASLYAAANDATSLAAAIVRLIDDPATAEQMGHLGQQRLRTALGWNLQVPQLLAAYARAIGKRERRTDPPGRDVGSCRKPAPSLVPRQERAESRPDADTFEPPADLVDCAVVIVTYNSARHVVGLLESLPAAAAGLTLRTIVVDNGSADSTVELVRGRADVSCVESGENLGYAGGINVGREHAGEYSALLVLNPDVILAPGSLREMFTGLRDPAVGIVVPMLLDSDGHRSHSLRRDPALFRAIGDGLLGSRLKRRPGWLSEIVWDEASYSYQHAVDWATGAAFLVSAACDRAVGPWDEQFFMYSEETDYATRARAAGFRVEYMPTAQVRHSGGGSGRSSALLALLPVSRIRYMTKHGKTGWLYRLVLIVAAAIRARDPSQRAALRVLLRRARWAELTAALQTPPHAAGAREATR